ncbi:hypothetical protein Taro_043148 [Colocasia esculenta]|uniref:Protein kinase domain-containing protein n=1 Tax=Colocasia esculenta TaxID=4460 RepID=A0A843WQN4_COLES|nr:hypothetical protein [Colocasia esculenta]
MVFEVGPVPFNPDGWGPPDIPASPVLYTPGGPGGGAVPHHHPPNVPFAPFSRSEKVGRIADWTRNTGYAGAGGGRGGTAGVFDFALDESSALAAAADDDSTFRLVDGKPPPRPKFGPRWRFQQRPQLPQRRDEEVEARKREAEKERARRDRLYHMSRSASGAPGGAGGGARREAAILKSSVDIQPEWTMLDQIPFSTFSKLSYAVPDPPEDLLVCGGLEFYDRSFDRVNPKNERRLERFKSRNFFKVTTTDDPVIRRLANEDKATVFATDAILSALMCAPRSLDLLSVNETSQEPLPEAKEDINSAYSLSIEAAYVNQNFSQQVLVRDGNKVTFEEPNPFAAEGEEVASVAYRYRRWKLDDDMYLVARCEAHAVSDVKGQRSFLTLNALNEFDPKYSGVDWRQKLETQRGAVLATELKNNANKLAKWTAQALLASADMMKLGEFAAQINLNTSNMWGIVKSIVDLCMKLNEGKYVLVKDPAKPQVRIYEVPADAFENDYVEEPLPEEEQVQPPAEEEDAGADNEEAAPAANEYSEVLAALEATSCARVATDVATGSVLRANFAWVKATFEGLGVGLPCLSLERYSVLTIPVLSQVQRDFWDRGRKFTYLKGLELAMTTRDMARSVVKKIEAITGAFSNRGPGRTPLDWATRVRIAAGTARGVAYIHQAWRSSPKLAHGNLKSTNILVDESGAARVADFGLASLATGPAAASGVARSNGYRAPELAADGRKAATSHKADVYSFGVLLLELLTGKYPSPYGPENGGAAAAAAGGGAVVDLPRWVQSVVREEWTAEVFDLELMRYKDIEEEMVGMLQIAMACTAASPDQRPRMGSVVKLIDELRGAEASATSPSQDSFDSVSDSPSASDAASGGHQSVA